MAIALPKVPAVRSPAANEFNVSKTLGLPTNLLSRTPVVSTYTASQYPSKAIPIPQTGPSSATAGGGATYSDANSTPAIGGTAPGASAYAAPDQNTIDKNF